MDDIISISLAFACIALPTIAAIFIILYAIPRWVNLENLSEEELEEVREIMIQLESQNISGIFM